jgi:hypothetical protein
MLFDSENFQKPRTESSLILKIKKTQNCEFFHSIFFQNPEPEVINKIREPHNTSVTTSLYTQKSWGLIMAVFQHD